MSAETDTRMTHLASWRGGFTHLRVGPTAKRYRCEVAIVRLVSVAGRPDRIEFADGAVAHGWEQAIARELIVPLGRKRVIASPESVEQP